MVEAGYGLGRKGVCVRVPTVEGGFFLFPIARRQDLGPSQPPGGRFTRSLVVRLEADYSLRLIQSLRIIEL
jgi:hypothetical protein